MTGCYAELVTRPAEEVFPLPDNVSFSAGAAIGVPYATAYYALFQRGGAKPGENLFIHGASGAVGTAAIQLARACGLMIIGSAGSNRGRDLVLEQGAHHVVDHTGDDYLQIVRELTNGEGPDLILEMLANVNLEKDLGVVARYGRIVIIGNRGTMVLPGFSRETFTQFRPRWPRMRSAICSRAQNGVGLDCRSRRCNGQWRFWLGDGSGTWSATRALI